MGTANFDTTHDRGLLYGPVHPQVIYRKSNLTSKNDNEEFP
jgi:hypothetical protein